MLIREWSQVLNQSLNPPTVLKHSRNMLACMRSDQRERERESVSILLLHQTLTDRHSTDSVNVCWWILLREEKDVRHEVCVLRRLRVCVFACARLRIKNIEDLWWREIMSYCKNSLSACLFACLTVTGWTPLCPEIHTASVPIF